MRNPELDLSLNQSAASTTTSSEPIFKSDHLIAIFKIKMTVVSRKQLLSTYRLGGSSHLPLQVML